MLIVTDDPPTDQVLHEGLLEVSKASVEPVLEVVATQEQQQDPLYRDDLFIPADLPASKMTDGALRISHFKNKWPLFLSPKNRCKLSDFG